eukprot:9125142-Pyramimonas_sp.AAC.1
MTNNVPAPNAPPLAVSNTEDIQVSFPQLPEGGLDSAEPDTAVVADRKIVMLQINRTEATGLRDSGQMQRSKATEIAQTEQVESSLVRSSQLVEAGSGHTRGSGATSITLAMQRPDSTLTQAVALAQELSRAVQLADERAKQSEVVATEATLRAEQATLRAERAEQEVENTRAVVLTLQNKVHELQHEVTQKGQRNLALKKSVKDLEEQNDKFVHTTSATVERLCGEALEKTKEYERTKEENAALRSENAQLRASVSGLKPSFSTKPAKGIPPGGFLELKAECEQLRKQLDVKDAELLNMQQRLKHELKEERKKTAAIEEIIQRRAAA